MGIMPTSMATIMATVIEFPPVRESLHRLRLLQLASSTLPVGAFTYSQGLEMAVEAGWVNGMDSLENWLGGALEAGVTMVDAPLFNRLYFAYAANDLTCAQHWINLLLACRETMELREEERQRGRAFSRLLPELEPRIENETAQHVSGCQLAGQAWLCSRWGIDPAEAMQTFAWSWMENLAVAGVKLIPLGQSDGQRLILRLGERIPAAIASGFSLTHDAIGSGCQALAIASSLHETQYTRLFRS